MEEDIKKDWDNRFIELAQHIASWSKDPSTKVGACIIDDDRKILGVGYNGFPRGVDDSPERYANRELKHKIVVHAEANAILNAVKSVEGCTLYCTFFPCTDCAGLIIQSGIKHIIYVPSESDCRYVDIQSISKMMFDEAGVTYEKHTNE